MGLNTDNSTQILSNTLIFNRNQKNFRHSPALAAEAKIYLFAVPVISEIPFTTHLSLVFLLTSRPDNEWLFFFFNLKRLIGFSVFVLELGHLLRAVLLRL